MKPRIVKSPRKIALVRKFMELDLPPGQTAITGSIWMELLGIREVGDLDAVAVDEAWVQACALGDVEFDPVHQDKRVRIGDSIEIFRKWLCWEKEGFNAREMIESALCIDGVSIAQIEHTIQYKQVLDREKDREDLQALEELGIEI